MMMSSFVLCRSLLRENLASQHDTFTIQHWLYNKLLGEICSAWKKKNKCGQIWLPRQEVRCFPPPTQIHVTSGGLTPGVLQLSTLFHLMPQLFFLHKQELSEKSPELTFAWHRFFPTQKLSLKDLLATLA